MTRTDRLRDHSGRFRKSLQVLSDAGLVRPMRISEYAPYDPQHIAAGDEIENRWVYPANVSSGIHLYEVGCLWWGDYIGDDINRSNHRSLLRDFPDQFVHLSGVFDSHGLALPPTFHDGALTQELLRLADRTYYDEDDHSALVDELAAHMWEGLLEFDVPAQLRDDHGVDPVELGVGDEQLRDMFFTVQSEYGDEHAETAVSVVFPSQDKVVAEMADLLRGEQGTGRPHTGGAGERTHRGAGFAHRPLVADSSAVSQPPAPDVTAWRWQTPGR